MIKEREHLKREVAPAYNGTGVAAGMMFIEAGLLRPTSPA